MTDRELNEALFQIVETDDVRTTDYCNDHAWCAQMIQKYSLCLEWCMHSDRAYVSRLGQKEPLASDPSLTRAVALVVLQLTREGKK